MWLLLLNQLDVCSPIFVQGGGGGGGGGDAVHEWQWHHP